MATDQPTLSKVGDDSLQLSRPRASTLQVSISPAYASNAPRYPGLDADLHRTPADIFDSLVEQDDQVTASLKDATSPKLLMRTPDLDDLPIEIRSLTERFLSSLTARTHPSPLAIEAIADLYQDFYQQAESHVATHIAARATLLSRAGNAVSDSSGPRTFKSTSRNQSTDTSAHNRNTNHEQQMLTAAEIVDRKRARRHLELQKDNLDESVERVVCEKLYDRIYRHRSGDDEERDAKLRSKTAALNLLGIGLKELHVNVSASKLATADDPTAKINEYLTPARESIRKMDDEHYPLGKLLHLKAAHKGIVDTLANLFPASSSADEVLPTLIYTLVTSLPDTLNVVSNLHFVQLFRAASRIDGETAYCLVNLEAAISFLETVDLSSLDTDRSLDEEAEPSDALTLHTGQNPLMASTDSLPLLLPPSSADVSAEKDSGNNTVVPTPTTGTSATSGPTLGHHRRLSSIIQNQKERIEAGRDSIVNTADHALESINTTLDSSIKFLFGRLQQQQSSPATKSPVTLPKTLDEARQLVSTPPLEDQTDGETNDGGGTAKNSTIKLVTVAPSSDPIRMSDGKLMEMSDSRRAARDHSTDSRASTGSGSAKQVSFATSTDKPAQSNETVGSFVNSLNPLSRFSVPSFPRFGRSISGSQPQTPPLGSSIADRVSDKSGGIESVAQPEADLSAVETLARLKSARPAEQKFLDIRDAGELKVGDVQALLLEFHRLAGILKQAVS